MGKKSMEIGLSIGSVLVLTAMLIMVNLLTKPGALFETIPQSYGFVASLVMFVLMVSGIGVKLAIYK
ncbi:MAG: hypothetical protein K8R64_01120 [Methanosarcinaceae archaeon]|nr:hypothetical protein [Methanosarcinaceae archaeon]